MIEMTEQLAPVSKPEAERISPYDKLIDFALDVVGADPQDFKDFLSDHPFGSRIAANTVTGGRLVAGVEVLNLYDQAIADQDSKTAVWCTVALLGVLSTDFVDGYIARSAGIAGSRFGGYLDAGVDVALRARIAKSIAQPESIGQKARAAGDLMVGVTTIPDWVKGDFKTSWMGKAKVNFDAVYVVSEMLIKALEASPDYNENDNSVRWLRRISKAGLVGATALAWIDGTRRMTKKIKKLKLAV